MAPIVAMTHEAHSELGATLSVARCLERGYWRPAGHSPRNFTAVRFISDQGRYRCLADRRKRGLDLELREWEPHGGGKCALHDAITGHFDGIFATRTVIIGLLSDSLGLQVRSAIASAMAANPVNLRGALHVA